MLRTLLSTTLLAILLLGQGAISAPQASPCGKPEDPPCPAGQSCCVKVVGLPAGVCGEVCALSLGPVASGEPEDPPCPEGQLCCVKQLGLPAGVCGEVCAF
ncbi:hypothetical protein B0H17DRAFT_408411 [Mycena rosella]|uniref:Uncharacterized protein n=1 Tax=Mycena rosella TaxID=1033263 RepID=A0AAD7CP58_MYCRO|nr:hypothetical protein B0H17DRAFT_408411 [Mycena rosella]